MTSGYMKCPKCGKDFQYADYNYKTENGLPFGKWIETSEPWKCPNCKSLIVVDKEKGYGLKVV